MDFRTPANYGDLQAGESLKLEKLGRVFEWPTLIVPEGSIVYRADMGGAKSPSANVPAFFSNDESITVYKRGNEGNVSKYRTTRDVRLFVMTVKSLKTLFAFHPELTEEDKEYMKIYLLQTLPEKQKEYLKHQSVENAVMPIYPTGNQYKYLNRAIAAIICRLGVDGWIVQPYEKGKTGMRNFSMIRPIGIYKPEFLICKWTDCMERITGGGKRGTRKTRKQNDKSRKNRTIR
jgi:hypothetical protein